jgi:hypothetical protein
MELFSPLAHSFTLGDERDQRYKVYRLDRQITDSTGLQHIVN